MGWFMIKGKATWTDVDQEIYEKVKNDLKSDIETTRFIKDRRHLDYLMQDTVERYVAGMYTDIFANRKIIDVLRDKIEMLIEKENEQGEE